MARKLQVTIHSCAYLYPVARSCLRCSNSQPPLLPGEDSSARQLQVIIHGRLCCPVARFLLRFLNPSCSRCRGRAIRLDNSRYASMRSCFPVARYFLNVIAIPSRPCCWGRTIRFDDSWYVRRAQYCTVHALLLTKFSSAAPAAGFGGKTSITHII